MVLASGSAETLSTTLESWGIAPVVTAATLPLVLGLLTGLTMSMVGIGFPLLLPLIAGSDLYLNHIVLAFGVGFTAILLSPLHLCLALTREYFKAEWAPLYRMLIPAAAMLGAATVVAWLIA
jgi:hypothetical protein